MSDIETTSERSGRRWAVPLAVFGFGAWVGVSALLFLSAQAIFGYVNGVTFVPEKSRPAIAGDLAGRVIERAHCVEAMLLLPICIGISFAQMKLRHGRLVVGLRWAAVLLLAASVGVQLLFFSPAIHDVRLQAESLGGMGAITADNPLYKKFWMLHGMSMLVEALAPLWAVLGCLLTVVPKSRKHE